jgi:hypothetical protein
MRPSLCKQFRLPLFYPHPIHSKMNVSTSLKRQCFLRETLLFTRFSLDCNLFREHDEVGSKRFEGQRAWREVADPER